jgi:hypothetical protein
LISLCLFRLWLVCFLTLDTQWQNHQLPAMGRNPTGCVFNLAAAWRNEKDSPDDVDVNVSGGPLRTGTVHGLKTKTAAHKKWAAGSCRSRHQQAI